jgi:VanZ family protein
LSRSHPFVAWIPAVVWMIGIFVASAQPKLPLQDDVPDYLSHSAAYLVLAFLWCFALARGGEATLRTALLAVVACTLYGVTDEWHQSFVPGRHSEARDVRNDALGATAGALVYAGVRATRRRRAASEVS